MSRAQPLKADQFASAEMLIPNTTVGSSAGSQGRLAVVKCNASNGPLGGPNCRAALGGHCSIPRAPGAPWCVGNCSVTGDGGTSMGTCLTALRIGPPMYVGNPGESFPEVNDAIRIAVIDAQSVNVVGSSTRPSSPPCRAASASRRPAASCRKLAEGGPRSEPARLGRL